MALKINVVLTCHNRVEKTVECIQTILVSAGDKYFLDFFICDDGSTDNTSTRIIDIFPKAHIIQGNGKLFWAKGMYLAMTEAKKVYCDYYLMVNDDVKFYPNMLDCLFYTYDYGKQEIKAVTGAIKDEISDYYTYGGIIEKRQNFKINICNVLPSNPPSLCDKANWNCFLISKKDYEQIGDVDNFYAHGCADYDYSYRICKRGGEILVSTEYVGTCSRNEDKNTWRDKTLPMIKRLKLLNQPNGFPLKSAIHYYWKTDKSWILIDVCVPYFVIVRDEIMKYSKKMHKRCQKNYIERE